MWMVPVRVSINKLYLVLKQIMAGLVGMLRNSGGLGRASRISLPCSLILSRIDLPVSLLTTHYCLAGSTLSLVRSNKCRFGFEDGANASLL